MEEVQQLNPGTESPEQDHMLQWFAQLANNGGYRIPITLTLSSGMMTGTLVSGEAFWEDFKQKMIPGVPEGHLATITESLDRQIAAYSADREFDENEPAPNYIHLLNAKMLSGNAFSPSNGMPWRGRISSVLGFAFGTVSPS